MLYTVGERFFVSGVARVGHLARDVEPHLPLEIEGAADLARLHAIGADAVAEIIQVRAAGGERGAGHDAAMIWPEEELAQVAGHVDRRRIERMKFLRLARLLDPINVV